MQTNPNANPLWLGLPRPAMAVAKVTMPSVPLLQGRVIAPGKLVNAPAYVNKDCTDIRKTMDRARAALDQEVSQ